MNRTMQYFKYMFNHHKKAIFLYTFICFISYPLVAIFNLNNSSSTITGTIQVGLISYFIYLVILCAVIPTVSFKYIYSKRAVDTYGALPISKLDMFIVHYLMPMIAICVPMLLNFILGTAILSIASGSAFMDFLSTIWVMIVTMKLMMVAYAISTFFAIRCNSFVDGIVVSMGMMALPYVMFTVITNFVSAHMVSTGNYVADLFTPVLSALSPTFVAGVQLSESMVYQGIGYGIWRYQFAFSWWQIFQVAIFVVFTVLAFKSFEKRKNEAAEQITTDATTYPLFIAVAGICLVSFVDFVYYDLFTSIILGSITFLVFLLLNLLAKRSMKFSWKIIVKYLVLLLLFNGVAYIAHQTELFGLNRRLVDLSDVKKIVIETHQPKSDSYLDGKLVIDLEDGISASEQKLIDRIQNFQIVASEQFKENRYGYDDMSTSFYDMVRFTISYVSEYEEDIKGQLYTIDDEYRYYVFEAEKVKDVLKEIKIKSYDNVYADSK